MKNVGICLLSPGYQRPPDVVRSRSYDPATPPEGPNGDGEARGRGIAADRGGGRLVRGSRGDPQPVGGTLPRARAVGLGPLDAADACDQDPACKAPPGSRRLVVAWRGFEPPDRGLTERARARIRDGALYGPPRYRHEVEQLPGDGAHSEAETEGGGDLRQ